MAIQGIFLADFSQYNAAVDGADAKLRKFTSATTTHDSAVRQFNRSTDGSSNSFGQLATGLSAADKTLAAFGVHITHEIHALDEISQAAGQSAKQIGLVGTASLVAAAAFGGWEIGRKVAEFLDLDNKIVALTDHIFNQGLATETAAAKQDSINLAIKRGADATVTYTEAVQFNAEWAKKSNERVKDAADLAKAHEKAMKDAADAAAKEADALQKLQKAQEDLVHGIADKLFGADDLKKATDYAEAIGRVENVTTMSAEAQKDLAEVMQKGVEAALRMGLGTDQLTSKFVELQLAATDTSRSLTQIETDEERLKRESAELEKAMKENFVVIGKSAEEAAQKTASSWSDAMAQVRAGKATMGGSFQSIAPGAPGSTIRYDDYGNPYGYIPGVNQPGKISPPRNSATTSIFVDARESFFDTPAGAQRLAEKVNYALGTQAASQGRY